MKNKLSAISLIAGAFLVLFFLTGTVSAASVTISPTTLPENGGAVTIAVSGLADDSSFGFRIESALSTDDNDYFGFDARNLDVPFALSGAEVSVRAEPVVNATLSADTGDTLKSMRGNAYKDVVKFTQDVGSLSAGTIDLLSVFGYAVPNSSAVDIALELSGTKTGTNDGSITFTLSGIQQGEADVIIYVDGDVVNTQTISIGAGAPPTAVPTATQVSSGGDSSGDSSDDTPVTNAGVIVSSIDDSAVLSAKKDSVSGTDEDSLVLTKIKGLTVPSDMVMLSGTYVLYPDTATFNPVATLKITIPDNVLDSLSSYSPFIAAYDDGTWVPLPSSIEGDVIETDILQAGKYAFLSYAPTVAATETVSGSETQATGVPTGSATAQITPSDAGDQPVSTAASTPKPSGSGFVLFLGVLALVGAVLLKKRV